MNATAPGWTRHEITDLADARAQRTDGSATVFEVLVRRRARATAGTAGAPVVASQAGATGAQNPVADCGSSGVPHFLDPSEAAVSPGQEANGRARSLAPMGSPALRPYDRGSATDSTTSSPSSVGGSVSVPTTAFRDLPSVKAMGTGRLGIIVGFDTECTSIDGERVIDSYQFAVPDPLDPSVVVEVARSPA